MLHQLAGVTFLIPWACKLFHTSRHDLRSFACPCSSNMRLLTTLPYSRGCPGQMRRLHDLNSCPRCAFVKEVIRYIFAMVRLVKEMMFLDCPCAMWSSAHPNSVRSSNEHCQRHSFYTPTFALQAIGRQRKNVPPLERVMRTPVNAFLREFPQYGLSRRY